MVILIYYRYYPNVEMLHIQTSNLLKRIKIRLVSGRAQSRPKISKFEI